MSFIPAPNEVAKEVITLLIATVAVSWIISKVPAAQRLVRSNSIIQYPTSNQTI
jgi:hypothetical protein